MIVNRVHTLLAFRHQDFTALSIQESLDYDSHFSPLHIHPFSEAPKGYPEIHLVRCAEYSNVIYEEEPRGTTYLYILDE